MVSSLLYRNNKSAIFPSFLFSYTNMQKFLILFGYYLIYIEISKSNLFPTDFHFLHRNM